jgi:hypothetical protein
MKKPTARRNFLFSAAFFLVGSLGCIYTYLQSSESGVLRLGSRHSVTITEVASPEKFQFWLLATVGAAIFFGLLALAALLLAVRSKRQVGR